MGLKQHVRMFIKKDRSTAKYFIAKGTRTEYRYNENGEKVATVTNYVKFYNYDKYLNKQA